MSATLMYEPKPAPRRPLSDEIKRVIQKAYSFDNGSITLAGDAVGFLRGLLAAGIEGSEELIDAINKHGAVKLYMEY